MGFICATILDAILVTNASKHANCASIVLGWFGASLVVSPLLTTTFAFWPLPKLGDFPTFPVWD
jgi:hypothetical protein